MDDYDILNSDQSDILRRFQEITNIQDEHVALATLASLNWDLETAIEAQLNSDAHNFSMEVDGLREHTLQENTSPPSASISHENGIHPTYSFSFENDDEQLRQAAGGSMATKDSNSSLHSSNGAKKSESSSNSHSRGAPGDYTSSATSSSAVSKSRSSLGSPATARANSTTENTADTDSDDDIFVDADSYSQSIDTRSLSPQKLEDRVPLVPSEFSSVEEAMHNFVAVFESRYGGNHPPFYSGILQNAVREAFEAPGRNIAERRPLAVYLHNDNAVACNIFAKNVICSDLVSSLLKGQFVVWPWDVTQSENKKKLFEWMDALNVRDIRSSVERLSDEKYPLLVVMLKEKGMIQVVEVSWGCEGAQQVVDKLMEGLDQYQRIKTVDTVEERKRIEREEIRQEQAREYEQSLALDRARQEKVERARNEKLAVEAKLAKEKEEKAKHLSELAASLPIEPAANEKSVATIRVRFPDGNMEMRRFRMCEPLRNIAVFVESKGYSLNNYRIWTSDVPKKNVVETFDLNRSLAETKWPVREQITVDEK